MQDDLTQISMTDLEIIVQGMNENGIDRADACGLPNFINAFPLHSLTITFDTKYVNNMYDWWYPKCLQYYNTIISFFLILFIEIEQERN